MKISTYFSSEEATTSVTALVNRIHNQPSYEEWDTIKIVAAKMDKVREFLGNPIHVNSWFRCRALNDILSKVPHSQHIKGEAVDFICPGFGDTTEIFNALLPKLEEFEIDQLILEGSGTRSWIHISFAVIPARPPRNKSLILR